MDVVVVVVVLVNAVTQYLHLHFTYNKLLNYAGYKYSDMCGMQYAMNKRHSLTPTTVFASVFTAK